MQIYEVGGCIRDEILGISSKDIDFSVVLGEHEGIGQDPFVFMENELRSMGFEIFLSTPEFLTVRARFPKNSAQAGAKAGLTADFVLARKESDYTDGRRPDKVEPGSLYDDLSRRDFTMNAIAKDMHSYIDPFRGMEDIEKRIIRAVGNPMDRLREDALRAVRAIRFSITKDFMIESDLMLALHSPEIIDLVAKVSDERIREELSKMFRHNTLRSIIRLHEFPGLMGALFSGSVSLDATMKTKGRNLNV